MSQVRSPPASTRASTAKHPDSPLGIGFEVIYESSIAFASLSICWCTHAAVEPHGIVTPCVPRGDIVGACNRTDSGYDSWEVAVRGHTYRACLLYHHVLVLSFHLQEGSLPNAEAVATLSPAFVLRIASQHIPMLILTIEKVESPVYLLVFNVQPKGVQTIPKCRFDCVLHPSERD